MLRNTSLKSKLIGGFLLMALVLLIGGLVGSLGVHFVNGNLKHFSELRSEEIRELAGLGEAGQNIALMTQSIVVEDKYADSAEKARLLGKIEEGWTGADKHWKAYSELEKPNAVEMLWGNLKPAWQAWRKENQNVLRLVKEDKREEARALFTGAYRAALEAAKKDLRELSESAFKAALEDGRTGRTVSATLKGIAAAGTVFGIVLSLALGVFLARSVTRPVKKVIEDLSESAEQFSEAAVQIVQSSSRLAQVTSEQASLIEGTSSVMRTMTTTNRNHLDQLSNLVKATTDAEQIRLESEECIRRSREV